MSEDTSDFEDVFDDQPEPEAEAVAETQAEPAPGEVKGEKELAEPESQGASQVEPEAEPAPPAGEDKEVTGRLSALLDEREKRQEAERKARELEARIAQFEQSRQPQQKPIDPIDNPEGFAAQQREYVESAIAQQRVQQSKMFAEQQHGADKVAEAFAAFDAACKSDPAVSAMSHSFMQSAHPMGEVVAWHQRQQLLSEIGGDPEAYRQRIIQEHLAQQPAQPEATAPESARVPRPLGKGGGSTGQETVSDDDAFQAAFR